MSPTLWGDDACWERKKRHKGLSVLSSLHGRENRGMGREVNESLRRAYRTAIPGQLVEEEINFQPFDKVFASAWLDEENIIVGTKCNRLVCMQQRSMSDYSKMVEIPMPERPASKAQTPRGLSQCGVHSIALNASRDMLVTGGLDPSDCVVYRLPSLTPVETCVGHADWVFGLAWVTDNLFVSGSRDSSVKLWHVSGEDLGPVNDEPVATKTEHTSKVRDIKYSDDLEFMATLSGDETLKVWDPHTMAVDHSYELVHNKELLCMALHEHLVAVGSQGFISLYDVRQRRAAQHVRSLDDGWGVRSLSFIDHMMTAGGGHGRISFYDMRAGAYVDMPHQLESGRGGQHEAGAFLKTGQGWLDHNDVYLEHFAGQHVSNAAYTHCWHPSGTKLFVGGGPLAFGLRGSYTAMWR